MKASRITCSQNEHIFQNKVDSHNFPFDSTSFFQFKVYIKFEIQKCFLTLKIKIFLSLIFWYFLLFELLGRQPSWNWEEKSDKLSNFTFSNVSCHPLTRRDKVSRKIIMSFPFFSLLPLMNNIIKQNGRKLSRVLKQKHVLSISNGKFYEKGSERSLHLYIKFLYPLETHFLRNNIQFLYNLLCTKKGLICVRC